MRFNLLANTEMRVHCNCRGDPCGRPLCEAEPGPSPGPQHGDHKGRLYTNIRAAAELFTSPRKRTRKPGEGAQGRGRLKLAPMRVAATSSLTYSNRKIRL